MTMHRFFVDPSSIAGKQVIFPAEIVKQIIKVLRLKISDKVIVLDNTGNEYLVSLQQINQNIAIGDILLKKKNASEPDIYITLYQALTPRDKFEVILQKGTEIGISAFVPVETKRSLVKIKDIKPDKYDRWQKIIKEAAEQSERGLIPKLKQPVRFEEAIINSASQGRTLCAWEGEKNNTIHKILKQVQDDKTKNISIFVGPEGGFEEEEINLVKKSGAIPVSLGSRVLRTETAGLVATALVLYELKDLDKSRQIF